jgi:hypothetical protein
MNRKWLRLGFAGLFVICGCAHTVDSEFRFPAQMTAAPGEAVIRCQSNQADTSITNTSVLHGCVSNGWAAPVLIVNQGTSIAQLAEEAASTAIAVAPKLGRPPVAEVDQCANLPTKPMEIVQRAKALKQKLFGLDVESQATLDEAVDRLTVNEQIVLDEAVDRLACREQQLLNQMRFELRLIK